MLFLMAEIIARSIGLLVKAPIPRDFSEMARLEYRSQVLIKAIKPILEIVVEAHFRNLQVADSLEISNRWTEASREKILTTLGYLMRQYTKLSFDALSGYQKLSGICYQTALTQGEPIPEYQVTTMVNFLELSKSYSHASVILARDAVNRAVESPYLTVEKHKTRDLMIGRVLQFADTLDVLIQEGLKNQEVAENLFNETGELIYEDALAIFEDNMYFLEENLKAVLELAYQTEQTFGPLTPLGKLMGIRLLKLDPRTYATRLNIPIKVVSMPVDTTWWYTSVYYKGWEDLEFRMKGWFHPTEGSMVTGQNNPVPQTDAYFRQGLHVKGVPIKGEIRFSGAIPEKIYWNGSDVSKIMNNAKLITSFVNEGSNVVAMKYKGLPQFNNSGTVRVFYVPKSFLTNSGG